MFCISLKINKIKLLEIFVLYIYNLQQIQAHKH